MVGSAYLQPGCPSRGPSYLFLPISVVRSPLGAEVTGHRLPPALEALTPWGQMEGRQVASLSWPQFLHLCLPCLGPCENRRREFPALGKKVLHVSHGTGLEKQWVWGLWLLFQAALG